MTSPRSVPVTQRTDAVQPRPRPEIEVGVPLYLPFVTPYQNAWEMLRAEDVTVLQLKAMRKTDGQARALYRLITLPVRAALKTATFVPENHIDGGDEEAAFCEQMFTQPESAGGMTIPFSRVLAQMLMAIFDGFSAFEMVYWSPKSGPLKGKWTLKKLANRPAETLTFLVNDQGEFSGFRQRTMFQGRNIDVKIPGEHCVYYSANEEEKAFYGQSYFQSAFFHWDKKFKLYAICHIAAQRAAVGTRVGTMPANPSRDEKEQFKKALADLGVAQFIAVPPDYKVEALKEGPNFDFLAYINHHNSQMSKSVLAAFFDDQQGSGGDTTLVDFGRQSDALFMMMLQTIMSEIEEVINQKIIPRFIDWNFGTAKYPKFQFGSLTEEQTAASIDLFKTLATAGQALTISPEFVHQLEVQVAEEFGLEIDWEAVEQAQEEQAHLEAIQAMQGESGQPGAEQPTEGAPPAGSPVIDSSVLPKGFTLTVAQDDNYLELNNLAADLLQEAAEELTLTRGVPAAGVKHVRTPAGSQVYGAPIGSPITRAMRDRLAAHGVLGKPFGGGIQDPNVGHKVLGGKPGARPQDPGGVKTAPLTTPKQILVNAKVPGVHLLDFGDGTVAVRDAAGRTSPRQRFDISQFAKLGWVVDAASKNVSDTPTKNVAEKAG